MIVSSYHDRDAVVLPAGGHQAFQTAYGVPSVGLGLVEFRGVDASQA